MGRRGGWARLVRCTRRFLALTTACCETRGRGTAVLRSTPGGDALFVAFPDPSAAVIAGQRAVRARAWPGGCELRVRMGVCTPALQRTTVWRLASARGGRSSKRKTSSRVRRPPFASTSPTLSTLPAYQSRRGDYGSSPRSSIAISSASGGRWPVSIMAAIDASSSSLRSRVSTPNRCWWSSL